MQKNSITNKITPCCGLPFSVIYWWVSNLTLNSDADRQYLLTQISQSGVLSIDGWKVLINSGTLEADASLTKDEFLAWFDCGKQPTCEQLELIIEGYKMGAWVGDLSEVSFVNVLGVLKITDIAPTTQGLYILSDVGTYTNLGGLVTTTGKINYAYFDGTTWSLIAVDMNAFQPKTSFDKNDNTLGSTDKAISDFMDLNLVKSNTDNTEVKDSAIPYVIADANGYIAFRVNLNGEVDLKPSTKTLEFLNPYFGLIKKIENGNNLRFCQIGDSITTWDNKYEDGFGQGVSEGATALTGYSGFGYGQVITQTLNISYANHKPMGRNGRAVTEFVSEGHINNIPTDCDIYTIFLGTNDWGKQYTNKGTMANYTANDFDANVSAKNTSYGAYRKILDKILNGRGNSTPIVILMTPMHRGLFGHSANLATTAPPDGVANSKGYFLSQFADMVKEIALYEGLPCLDLFNDGVILRRFLNQDTTWDTSQNDGRPANYQDVFYDNVHPTTKGHLLIGTKLLQKVMEKLPELYVSQKLFS